MIVKKTKQLGNFKKGINLYIPKRTIATTTADTNGLYGKRYVGYFNEDVNWFIFEVNALKLEVVTKLLVSIVPPDPVSTVILNWEAFPLVKVIVFPTAEAVVRSEAVLALGKMTNEPVPS